VADLELDPQIISRVRDASDIVEIVGDEVKLRRAGRRWQGLCPFHDEKTPSFSVNPERGLYYCFGCHAGGDVIDFVMRLESLSFPEAVERLARRFGVHLPAPSPEARRRRQEADQQRSILDEAQLWFTQQLMSPDGANARGELERRGFDAATWPAIGFGFAPDDWRQLLQHLVRRHAEKAVIEAGLAVSSDRGRPYDRFRGRITFPIRASDGRLVAFGGRILGDGEPKYLNSPEGPLFSKRSTLFSLDRARRAIADDGAALVVEGYFDCLSLHRAGIANVVATLGTSLTAEHARILRRLASNVVLCYDGDRAGRRAAVAGSRVLLEAGVAVTMLVLPAGKDPDDVVRELGPDAFREIAATPTPLLDFLLADVPSDPVARRAAAAELAELLGAAHDPVTRFSLLEELARRLDLPLQVVEERARAGDRGRSRAPRQAAEASSQRIAAAPSNPGEILLARILLEASLEIRERVLRQVDPELLGDARVRRLFERAAREIEVEGELCGWHDDAEVAALVADLANRPMPDLDERDAERQLRIVLAQQAREKARQLKQAIEAAERANDLERLRELQEEHMRLRREAIET